MSNELNGKNNNNNNGAVGAWLQAWLPAILALMGIAGAWGTLQSELGHLSEDVDRLELKIDHHEAKTGHDTLQTMVEKGIEARLERLENKINGRDR